MDTITLSAVTREISEQLLGGRVQAILQPDEQSLVLEIYNHSERRWLLLSADTQHPRVHLLGEKARRGIEKDSPFLLLARKYLRGARLGDIFQPAWERVLHLRFHHPEVGTSTLVGEIMGRWSNLLLLDPQGIILEALRRFGPGESRYRVILPGKTYVQPPPQTGKQPVDLADLPFFERLFNQASANTPLWRVLVREVGGVSPLAAREISYRATGETQADVAHPNARPQALLDAISWYRNLPQQGGWAPTIALDPSDESPAALAPYALSHLDTLRYYPSISEAAEIYYQAVLSADSYAGRRKQVLALLEQARKKLYAKRASLGKQAVSEAQVDELRGAGEWILAYAWQTQPGDAVLKADTGEEVLTISLDPTLSASENAQDYFARYRKAKRAAAKIPSLLAVVDRDLAYLDQLQTDLTLADNAPQIEELREALLVSGLISGASTRRQQPIQRSRPLRLESADGFTIIVGRNALQNEQVTWKQAKPEDLWLHAQRMPGSHVVVKTNGLPVPQKTLEQAASWAAYHSKARNDTKVSVIYTQRRHLRKIKGGRPGQVRVLQSKSITIPPEAPGQER
ncbi:MAG: fibronectin/fibrinogen-binding protein [Chloroflexi bacterium]|nr:fibronectin/fibrinogen-binding protein [Chloroflexota bacterium]